jgi:3-isopropylmalate/(R)-2-methylmalate dehydratase small subunit
VGRTFVFGDNIDTDIIVPGCYLSLSSPEELAGVCMEGYQKGFAARIKKGDIFVAGSNFGCGSSREHAPLSIKAAGVDFVIAESFARIFYRNAINVGLPIIEAKEAARSIKDGDEITVDAEDGEIFNVTKNERYKMRPLPPFIMEIVKAGGQVNYIKNKNRQTRNSRQSSKS